jgi:hypothetical protein
VRPASPRGAADAAPPETGVPAGYVAGNPCDVVAAVAGVVV